MIPLITKTCARCKEKFSFYETSKTSTNNTKYCNQCRKEIVREAAKKSKKKMLHAKMQKKMALGLYM